MGFAAATRRLEETANMLIESPPMVDDPRTVPILAKSIYRELRTSGLTEKERRQFLRLLDKIQLGLETLRAPGKNAVPA